MTRPQWQVVRRPLLLLATWVTGTIVAMVVAWQAVTLVGHQVTESRPSELSPQELIARTVPTSTTTTTAAVRRATDVHDGHDGARGDHSDGPLDLRRHRAG